AFISRREKRKRQNWKSCTAWAYPDNSRLTVTGLKVTLRPHVVVDLAQIKLQLFPIEDVQSLEAANQPGFFYILHLTAKFAITEDLIAFKLNFNHAYALAFVNHESKRRRGGRNLVSPL